MEYFGEPADARAARRFHLDPVEAVVVGDERRLQRAVGLHRHRHLRLVVDDDRAAGGGHRRHGAHPDLGAAQDGDVAAVFDLARLQAGVGREVVLQLELLDVGHVGDLERVDAASGRRAPR